MNPWLLAAVSYDLWLLWTFGIVTRPVRKTAPERD